MSGIKGACLAVIIGLCTLIIIFVSTAIMIAAAEFIILPGSLAKIEQLRKAAALIDIRESEDIMGQVVQTNSHIRAQQKYNRVWWSAPFIPDEWDTVELIPIPKRD